MERDHPPQKPRSRGVTLALVVLELLAQVLSLSLLPAAGSVGGVSPACGRAVCQGHPISREPGGSAVLRLLEDLLSGSRSSATDREDGEEGLITWPLVELIVRQKSTAAPQVQPSPPQMSWACGAMAIDGPGFGAHIVPPAPPRLSRLTC
jgi:hypothetical protein